MVWPKLSVSNYREMLRKLSTSAFFVTTACVWLLRSQIATIDALLRKFDVTPQVKILDSISIPFGTFFVAFIIAFASEAIKLHDKMSDLLRIRAVFDVRWILIPMALISGATVRNAGYDRITSDRSRLMREVFYKYASSSKDAAIDSHLIVQALTAWSWYWLSVETVTIIIPTTVVLMWFSQWPASTLALIIVLVFLLFMKVFRAEAGKYASEEVSEILGDRDRRQAVKAVFDAL